MESSIDVAQKPAKGLSPFGKLVRIHQINKNITNANIAKALAMSPPYLSSMLYNRKRTPNAVVEGIIKYLDLSDLEAFELEVSANSTNNYIEIDVTKLDTTLIKFATLFARRFKDLNKKELAEITKQLTRSDEASEYK